jgi:hypothetical protein
VADPLVIFADASQIWAPVSKEQIMSRFDTYHESFPNARLTRSKSGVLEVVLHIDGARWSSMDIPMNSLSTYFMRSGLTLITASSS